MTGMKGKRITERKRKERKRERRKRCPICGYCEREERERGKRENERYTGFLSWLVESLLSFSGGFRA